MKVLTKIFLLLLISATIYSQTKIFEGKVVYKKTIDSSEVADGNLTYLIKGNNFKVFYDEKSNFLLINEKFCRSYWVKNKEYIEHTIESQIQERKDNSDTETESLKNLLLNTQSIQKKKILGFDAECVSFKYSAGESDTIYYEFWVVKGKNLKMICADLDGNNKLLTCCFELGFIPVIAVEKTSEYEIRFEAVKIEEKKNPKNSFDLPKGYFKKDLNMYEDEEDEY